MEHVDIEQFEWYEPGTYFVTWGWSKPYVRSYDVEWKYCMLNSKGQQIWMIGSRHSVDPGSGRQDTFSVPAKALWVEVHITPIAETYKVDNMNVPYWTATVAGKNAYVGDNNKPNPPSDMTTEISPYNPNLLEIKFRNIKNDDANKTVHHVEIQIIRTHDESTMKCEKVPVSEYGTAKYSVTLEDGYAYAVRSRTVTGGDNVTSDWGDWSDEIWAPPFAPIIDNIRAESLSSVFISWPAVQNGLKYEIQYTENQMMFESGNPTSVTTLDNQLSQLIEGLSPNAWYFRVRTINKDGAQSKWSDIKKIVIGKKSSAPTTWSEKNVLYYGESETVRMYWIHNSPDNSREIRAALIIFVDGLPEEIITVDKEKNEYGEYEQTSYYDYTVSEYPPGTLIEWFVATVGSDVSLGYGDYSVSRRITIYSKPELTLTLKDVPADAYVDDLPNINTFPIHFTASVVADGEQKPTGYYVQIVADESFDYIDAYGERKYVNAGSVVFDRYYNVQTNLDEYIAASDVRLSNLRRYTLVCTVSMSSGLIDTAEHKFRLDYDNPTYSIESSIGYNEEFISASINMRAVNPDGTIPEDVSLSLYRINRDGSMVEIVRDVQNDADNYVTDPHPTLRYAQYRIIATDLTNGNMTFYDTPAYPISCTDIVIQWDEQYRSTDASVVGIESTPVILGSMLRLPYNIDVSESADIDNNQIKYIGRKNPVTYWGTHVGYSASWSSEIPKTDTDTLNTLRKLQVYPGNVYVREPSGTGYWAAIKISFNVNHNSLTIPVSIDVTKVEGGI